MRDELSTLELGGGRVETTATGGFKLTVPSGLDRYADAQLDDYRHLPRSRFRWTPPFRLEVQARATPAKPLGTLGFGFWNDPFALSLGQGGAARRLPTLPQAAWFFYGSPPNDLSLGGESPPAGWLAMTMRSIRVPTGVIGLPLFSAWVLAKAPRFRGVLFRAARGILHADSATIPASIDAWHGYTITWLPDRIEFRVDDELVLRSNVLPHGPLGFVAWIDNQYLCASPRVGLRFGVLPTRTQQTLELKSVSIDIPKIDEAPSDA